MADGRQVKVSVSTLDEKRTEFNPAFELFDWSTDEKVPFEFEFAESRRAEESVELMTW